MNADDRESGWHTLWAMLALVGRAGSEAALVRARDWVVSVPVLESTSGEMQAELQKTLAIDFSLRGLPWLDGQASWAEPTALGILALTLAPSTPESASLVSEAVRYQVDRRCVGGGWNFGNPVMLGAPLPARAHTTAVSLLALGLAAADRIEADDVAVLRRQIDGEGGSLALAWGLLALKRLNEQTGDLATRLGELQRADGSWDGDVYHTAMAMIAGRGSLWPGK